MGDLLINTVRYKGDIVGEGYVPRRGQTIQLAGVSLAEQDTSVNRFRSPGFPLGIGWVRSNRTTGRGVGGVRDATVDTGTRPVTLAKLHVATTHASPADFCRKMTDFKGNLWGLFEKISTTGADTVESRQFDGADDTWKNGGTVFTGGAVAGAPRGQDLVVHKGSLFAAVVVDISGTDNLNVYSSADGATWADATGTGWTAYDCGTPIGRTTSHPFTDDYARLLPFGNTLLFAGWDEDGSGNIEIQETTDSGTNWSATLATNITSRAGPRAFLDWYNLSLTRSPVLVTVEGVYALDLANNIATLIYAMDGHLDNGRFAEVGHDAALYIGLAEGKLVRLAILEENKLEVTFIGPPGEGLVAARQGRINYILKTPSKWLLVAMGGDSSTRNASIFKVDTNAILTDPDTGERFMPWHHVYRHATAELEIVAMAYSTNSVTAANVQPRIHFVVEGAAGGGKTADTVAAIEEPFTHPDSGVTINYQTSGVLRLPDDAMGNPSTVSTIYRAYIDANDMTANETMQLQAGLDGAADDNTTIGTFSTGTTLAYGTSGVRAKRIAQRLNFARGGTTTLSPKLNEFEFRAKPIHMASRFWDVVIDLEETAKAQYVTPQANLEDDEIIIAAIHSLATATGATTTALFEFKFSESVAAVRVQIATDPGPSYKTNKVGDSRENLGYRTGKILLRLEEVAA